MVLAGIGETSEARSWGRNGSAEGEGASMRASSRQHSASSVFIVLRLTRFHFWRVVISILIAISWVVPWSAQFGELTSTRFNVDGGCEENVFVLWLLTRISHVIEDNMSCRLASHCLESGSLRRLSDGIFHRLSFKIHLFERACS